MKEIVIQKLYRDKIYIQNIVLNKCLQDKEDIKVFLKGAQGHMILKPEEFRAKGTLHERVYENKFKGRPPYKLVSFDWNPIK